MSSLVCRGLVAFKKLPLNSINPTIQTIFVLELDSIIVSSKIKTEAWEEKKRRQGSTNFFPLLWLICRKKREMLEKLQSKEQVGIYYE
jgi:hypothetical protein